MTDVTAMANLPASMKEALAARVALLITPSVGRIVHLYRGSRDRDEERVVHGPHAAIIIKVHTDRLIDIVVFGTNHDTTATMQRVPLLQGDEKPPAEIAWCQWMDYQKGQAAKAEQLEKQIAAGGAT